MLGLGDEKIMTGVNTEQVQVTNKAYGIVTPSVHCIQVVGVECMCVVQLTYPSLSCD